MKISITLNEILATFLFSPGVEVLRDNLLRAYASQYYSMEQGLLYNVQKITNIECKTDRNVLPHIYTIQFDAEETIEETTPPPLIAPSIIEREYRRRVEADHPHIIKRLGRGYGLMLNNNLHPPRLFEYRLDNYRLVIEPPNNYYIQFKKFLNEETIFCDKSLTLEKIYTSAESQKIMNPIFVRGEDGSTILGVTSFLDNAPFNIKTIYLEQGKTILYYRYEPYHHHVSFSYMYLEHELDDDDDDNYHQTSLQLEASLIGRKEMGDKMKGAIPKHTVTPIDTNRVAYRLLKLNGQKGNLEFYDKHFVINTRLKSTSHPHLLSLAILHKLRDFNFIVETDLYPVNHYRPTAIIDINTLDFNAEQRMDIIQKLRIRLRNELAPYYIFFQGETGILGQKEKEEEIKSLKDGKIYEVLLNEKQEVERVIKCRPDKRKANSRWVIKEINDEKRLKR